MSGSKVEWPKEAVSFKQFTHCYGHSLNLAACDTLFTFISKKMIKYSPQRERISPNMKENLLASSSPGVRVLCPTQWTVRAETHGA